MGTRIWLVGIALAFLASSVFAQVHFTPPSPYQGPPRLGPSKSLSESIADTEAVSRFWERRKAKRAAEKRRAQRRAWGPDWSARQYDDDRSTERRARKPVDPRDYMTDHIEPGHIPYGCGHISNPRARRDCQETWQANNPNDRLNYGR